MVIIVYEVAVNTKLFLLFLREIRGHVPASNQKIFISRSVHALVLCMFLSRVTLCHVNVERTASGPVTHTGMEIM